MVEGKRTRLSATEKNDIWGRWIHYPNNESMRVSHETIYRSLSNLRNFFQVRSNISALS